MTQLTTRKEAEFQQRHLEQINEACLEALQAGERVARNVRTSRFESKARTLAGTLDWVRQTPLVERWMDLECRIIDPKTGEVKETKVFRKKSTQQIKQAKHMNSAGRIVAPLNIMIVDVEGETVAKTFGDPQGYRSTEWSAKHGRLTAEERKAIKQRQKLFRKMSEPVRSPAKSRAQKLQELSGELEELKRLLAQIS